jgi:hypothetical protein
MWGAILAATEAADVAVVLTTHSMEEVNPKSTTDDWHRRIMKHKLARVSPKLGILMF